MNTQGELDVRFLFVAFGGPVADVLEPLPEGERCAGAADLPAPLVEALRGPLFADLGWNALVLEGAA